MVAFHFQFSSQAGWKCDSCRKSGLERKRRCGWLGIGDEPQAPPVWARRNVCLATCPKSFITAESASLLEDFWMRRRLGGMALEELSGRQADAFTILETAVAAEMKDGQQNTRSAI